MHACRIVHIGSGMVVGTGVKSPRIAQSPCTPQARYSGLIDVLEFAEGTDADFSSSLDGATTWVSINTDATRLEAQLASAAAAGVKRAYIHTVVDADTAVLSAALASTPIDATLMRTGELSSTASGGGMLVDELDVEECGAISREDVFRFITEALTIPEASGRSFSLLPSSDSTMLKEMRLAGCERREEVTLPPPSPPVPPPQRPRSTPAPPPSARRRPPRWRRC